MPLIAGVDSSTQSCKVVVRDAESGALLRQGRAAHPAGTEIDPAHWWSAFERAAAAAGGLADIDALSVAAQQHGMVSLTEDGSCVRPALLWNDTRSAAAAQQLVAELGGARAWADAVGVVPLAAITVAKLRWFADNEPAAADRTAGICLPHDWLSWQLTGAGSIDSIITDRSDASGTGYYATTTGRYRTDLLELAFGTRRPVLPRVAAPNEITGVVEKIAPGAALGPGTGDNAAAALALDARDGEVIVSLGTSGVVSAVSTTVVGDASGAVAAFADATGRQLPLLCTLNGAPVLDAVAGLLGVDHERLAELALNSTSDGLVLVPYLSGERTPDRPAATGAVHGLRLTNATPGHFARAAFEGLLCGLADGIDRLRAQGVRTDRVLLVGGGARSRAVRELAPAIFGMPVAVPDPGEYVADGAARQAAWALSGATDPPPWPRPAATVHEAEPNPHIRERYAAVRDLTDGSPLLG